MPISRVMTGPRAQVIINGEIVGVFNSINWNYTLDLRNVDILGRFSTAEIVNTGMEPVEVSCSGYRVINAGPHVSMSVPLLQDLLSSPNLELAVIDRATGQRIAKIHQCKSSGYSTAIDAKGIESLTAHYRGILVDDESATNSETPGASTLP